MPRATLSLLLAAAAATTNTTTDWRAADTWVGVVGASRFFSNYRHAANALALRRVARRLGVPRERVIVLMAEDPTPDSRHPHRARDNQHATTGASASPASASTAPAGRAPLTHLPPRRV